MAERATGAAPIIDGKFSFSKTEGEGNVIIDSEFISPTACQGIITFTKGFFFVDFALDREVIIPWTASPSG